MKTTELALKEATIVQERRMPSPIEILEGVVKGGITSENMMVVKDLREIIREERDWMAKKSFNADFFNLKKDIATLQICADKVVKTDKGVIAYVSASEKELSEKLEPLLLKHGFTMLFGQRQDDNRTVAIITLMHQEGHDETREYAVRSGATNRMKDDTQADTGATTSAWRHLVIKFFGLKSRIREDDDARNVGNSITPEQAQLLRERVEACHADEAAFLRFAGATSYETIPALRYDELNKMLAKKEAAKRPKEEKNEQGEYKF